MFAKKLFQNKKAQYAKAMRRYWASQERTYRQLKARQLYNEGKDISGISYELGVGIDTITKYLRETEHLTGKEVDSELSAVESQIQSRENFARFMLRFIKYFFYLLFYFLFLPSIFEAFESSINWYMFFWKNWWIGVVAVPLVFYLGKLYKKGTFKKLTSATADYNTKINGLGIDSSEDLSTPKGRNNVIIKLDNFVKLYKSGSLKKLNPQKRKKR